MCFNQVFTLQYVTSVYRNLTCLFTLDIFICINATINGNTNKNVEKGSQPILCINVNLTVKLEKTQTQTSSVNKACLTQSYHRCKKVC